jgi:galactose mutarotase-like enzyme
MTAPVLADHWIQITSGELSAAIDPHGAHLSLLRDAQGRDLLWDGNPAFWSGRAPLLFPIVGMLREGHYRLGSKRYALPRHGFARNRDFEVLEASATSAALRLSADAETLSLFPFHFELEVRFTVQAATLTITVSIRNLGAGPMPASFGFHPGFRWPLPYGQPKAAHTIAFEADERGSVRRLNPDGLLSPQPHPTPIADRRLALTDDLFREDVLILDPVCSQSVTYGAPGAPRLRIAFPDTPLLGLWMKPGGDFICIEPWHGVSDPEDFKGEFTAKPGIFSVPPGGAQQISLQIELQPR